MKKILTDSQRKQLLSIDHLSEEDFKSYYSFSKEDMTVIKNHRGYINQFGFSLQLCLIRYPGCSLSNWNNKSKKLFDYILEQLEIPTIKADWLITNLLFILYFYISS